MTDPAVLPCQATDELLKLMSLFVLVHSDTTEQELREIVAFKRQTLQMYLQVGRGFQLPLMERPGVGALRMHWCCD